MRQLSNHFTLPFKGYFIEKHPFYFVCFLCEVMIRYNYLVNKVFMVLIENGGFPNYGFSRTEGQGQPPVEINLTKL